MTFSHLANYYDFVSLLNDSILTLIRPADTLPMTPALIDREHITGTQRRIGAYVRRTPAIEVDARDFELGAFRVIFKLEMLQHAGSFKARGAFANLLLRRIPPAGVAAASGGNHGVAVAYAAHRLGVPARRRRH